MKKINALVVKTKNALAARSGEAYIDTVVKIVIVAVLGVLVFLAVRAMTTGLLDKAQTSVDNLSANLSE